jgi:hypothetical protein
MRVKTHSIKRQFFVFKLLTALTLSELYQGYCAISFLLIKNVKSFVLLKVCFGMWFLKPIEKQSPGYTGTVYPRKTEDSRP